ncbi:hypothetical protein RZS28_00805 [Methylocapsa polymorpha]|uniref:Uncharacterized protein n=1 Tax=Methylocapsa polymorpha TaxID=3080828 RepID=A0ABZ0HTK7_9HYPH|nr:hypothetical protein RZS28_00805 [Methylocapsa sp. RX1]
MTMIDERRIIEILSASSQLLQQKDWDKYAMARDKNGVACDLNNRNASFYCLSGALVTTWRMLDPANEDFYFKYFERMFSEVLIEKYNYDRTLTQWNDNVARSREDIVQLIHSVIGSIRAPVPPESGSCEQDSNFPTRRHLSGAAP